MFALCSQGNCSKLYVSSNNISDRVEQAWNLSLKVGNESTCQADFTAVLKSVLKVIHLYITWCIKFQSCYLDVIPIVIRSHWNLQWWWRLTVKFTRWTESWITFKLLQNFIFSYLFADLDGFPSRFFARSETLKVFWYGESDHLRTLQGPKN